MIIKTKRKLPRKSPRSFRLLKEFDNHEMVISFTDNESKLKGYISIHNTNLGPALGGTRLQTYSSDEAALRDSLNLSKAMSYKCALAGLSWGGGKAVIIADNSANRDAQLKAYARYVQNLGGLFKTGTDVGIFDEDVVKMSKFTEHMLGVTEDDRGDMTTSKMAALGVYYSIKVALKDVYGTDSAEGRRIGIKGVGKLGGELASLLYAEGADITIADIDEKKTKQLLKKFPKLSVVDPNSIHAEKLDVFSPCALGNELRPKIIKELDCSIIAGGANNQLIDDRAGDNLLAKSILYVPDYIANAGGLIYVADELEPDGFSQKRVLERVQDIQKTVQQILEQSKKQKIATHRIANNIALARMGKNGK